MTVRNLTEADYTAVLALYTELDRIHYEARPDYFGQRECAYPKDAYDECVTDAETLMLGAFEDEILLGTVRATLWNKSGMIEGIKTVCLDNIYVLPEGRRRGIAKALFQAMEDWARAQGAVRLDLHVWDFNKNALALYEAMGMDYQYHVMEKRL